MQGVSHTILYSLHLPLKMQFKKKKSKNRCGGPLRNRQKSTVFRIRKISDGDRETSLEGVSKLWNGPVEEKA